ncbi:MAG: hypothetical protein J0L79_05220 [Rickettsiales bacterium]|nr:hypothetical protein [Rickettsiales bacterium]MCA0254208.1 hypothetical protein [Pseudomonadota bacterium]
MVHILRQLVSLYSQSYSVKLLESAFEEILSFGRSCLKNNKPYKAIKYLQISLRFIDYAHNAESVHNDLQIAYEKVGHPIQ